MAARSTGRRPGGVTLVAVLTWISGVLDIVGGVGLLVLQQDDSFVQDFGVQEFGGTGALTTAAIVGILIGIIVVAVANGLLRGNSGSRLVITLVQVISIGTAVFTVMSAPSLLASELVGALLAAVVLLLLWSRSANAFFRG